MMMLPSSAVGRILIVGTLVLAGCVVIGNTTLGQQPPATSAMNTGFKRIQRADAHELAEQLRKVPEVDLMRAQNVPVVADYLKTLNNLDWRDGRWRSVVPDDELKSLHRQHQQVCATLGLSGLDFSQCQLDAPKGKNLRFWSAKLRNDKLISIVATGETEWTDPLPFRIQAFQEAVTNVAELEEGLPAFMQMLQAEGEPSRHLLVALLQHLVSPDGAKALARRALFDPSPEIRTAAVEALRGRPKDQFRQILLDGLRYPWPPIAAHAAEALVNLDDREAVPSLEKLLNEPDPRFSSNRNRHEEAPLVREIVKINHLRNCILCHPLSIDPKDPVRGSVPDRDSSLAPLYLSGLQFVRGDITYLRQDFSLMQPADKSPYRWPTEQRYDFLVRTRAATPHELDDLAKRPASASFPQRDAVLFALTELRR